MPRNNSSRTLPKILLFFLLLLLQHSNLVLGATAPNRNAYEILGVTRSATQDEIRNKYRQLCLKYHPDKNVQKKESERKQCEDTFKEVQKANSHIGDAESRVKYDDELRQAALVEKYGRSPYGNQYRSSNTQGGSSPYYSSHFAESMFRSFYEQQRRQQFRRRTAFYVNGIDISSLFPEPGKSVYVTQVSVPLGDLYNGKAEHTFTVKESVWNRYRAAVRGGSARQIALQGLLSSMAILLKSGWSLSICVFGIYFHCQLPQLRRTTFSTRLQRGWKAGTKLKFENVEPGIDVIFVLQEQKDDNFERFGNDLITTMIVARSDLNKNKKRTGRGKCRLHLKMFGEHEGKLEVLLNREEVKKLEKLNTTEITLKGRGWPVKGGGSGDLKVKIRLEEDLKRSSKKRKNKLPSSRK